MKLFFDEDAGARVARALNLIGENVSYIGQYPAVARGTPDEDWLRHVGERGYLVVSRNHRMLRNSEERALIVSERIGIVFFPAHATRRQLLALVLRLWDRLGEIDVREPRPFVFHADIRGRLRQDRLE